MVPFRALGFAFPFEKIRQRHASGVLAGNAVYPAASPRRFLNLVASQACVQREVLQAVLVAFRRVGFAHPEVAF